MDATERLVRVISDGDPRRTKVINPATGEEIPGVYSIKFEIRAEDRTARVTLELYAQVDVVAALDVLPKECPFDDGRAAEFPDDLKKVGA